MVKWSGVAAFRLSIRGWASRLSYRRARGRFYLACCWCRPAAFRLSIRGRSVGRAGCPTGLLHCAALQRPSDPRRFSRARGPEPRTPARLTDGEDASLAPQGARKGALMRPTTFCFSTDFGLRAGSSRAHPSSIRCRTGKVVWLSGGRWPPTWSFVRGSGGRRSVRRRPFPPSRARTRTRVTWLILPVVICLSQRLSHACLSTSLTKVKPRMAH